MDRHLIVVSVDALVYEDLDYAATLPAFGRLIQSGSRIEHVRTIYPTLTHPVHASILTGQPAGITGVIANTYFMPGCLDCTWYNQLEEIRCDTLLHAARRAGLTTAVCRWPVTAGTSGVIDYLVPEIMSRDMQLGTPLEVYARLGATSCLMGTIAEALEQFESDLNHPVYDEVALYCAKDILRTYKPHLLLTHPGYVDAARHDTGLFGDGVKEAIRVTDRWLDELLDTVKDAGLEDTTDLIVLSDHGHLSYDRIAHPNVYLAQNGLLQLDAQGKLAGWDAYVTTSGLSARVYVAHPEDAAMMSHVETLLRGMAQQGSYGFGQVFTRDEVQTACGLTGDFSFILETDGHTTFADHWQGNYFTYPNDGRRHANHGHLPYRGPQPVLLAMGPSIKPHTVIENGDILEHVDLFADILSISLLNRQRHGTHALYQPQL